MISEPLSEERMVSAFCPLIEDYVQIRLFCSFERSGNDVIEKIRHRGCSYKECKYTFSKECEVFMQVDFS